MARKKKRKGSSRRSGRKSTTKRKGVKASTRARARRSLASRPRAVKRKAKSRARRAERRGNQSEKQLAARLRNLSKGQKSRRAKSALHAEADAVLATPGVGGSKRRKSKGRRGMSRNPRVKMTAAQRKRFLSDLPPDLKKDFGRIKPAPGSGKDVQYFTPKQWKRLMDAERQRGAGNTRYGTFVGRGVGPAAGAASGIGPKWRTKSRRTTKVQERMVDGKKQVRSVSQMFANPKNMGGWVPFGIGIITATVGTGLVMLGHRAFVTRKPKDGKHAWQGRDAVLRILAPPPPVFYAVSMGSGAALFALLGYLGRRAGRSGTMGTLRQVGMGVLGGTATALFSYPALLFLKHVVLGRILRVKRGDEISMANQLVPDLQINVGDAQMKAIEAEDKAAASAPGQQEIEGEGGAKFLPADYAYGNAAGNPLDIVALAIQQPSNAAEGIVGFIDPMRGARAPKRGAMTTTAGAQPQRRRSAFLAERPSAPRPAANATGHGAAGGCGGNCGKPCCSGKDELKALTEEAEAMERIGYVDAARVLRSRARAKEGAANAAHGAAAPPQHAPAPQAPPAPPAHAAPRHEPPALPPAPEQYQSPWAQYYAKNNPAALPRTRAN